MSMLLGCRLDQVPTGERPKPSRRPSARLIVPAGGWRCGVGTTGGRSALVQWCRDEGLRFMGRWCIRPHRCRTGSVGGEFDELENSVVEFARAWCSGIWGVHLWSWPGG
jgi:hypothetical protein